MNQKIMIEEKEENIVCYSKLRATDKTTKSLVTSIPMEVIKRLSLKPGDKIKFSMRIQDKCIDFDMEIEKEE